MKKITLLALIGALMLALVGGTAVAERGSGNSGNSGSGNSGKKVVTYNFDGTATAVTLASTGDPVTGVGTTSDTITVDVEKGNKAARTFVDKNGDSQTFKVDSNTKIEVNENEDATLEDVQVGDEVKVQVKAPPSATAPLTARHLHVENEDDENEDD